MYKLEKEIFEGKEIEVAVGYGQKLYLIKDICSILGFKKTISRCATHLFR